MQSAVNFLTTILFPLETEPLLVYGHSPYLRNILLMGIIGEDFFVKSGSGLGED